MVWQALHMWRFFNVKQLRTEMLAQLEARTPSSGAPPPPGPPPRTGPVHILRASTRDKLRRLAETGLSDFDFDRILDAVSTTY